MAAGGLEAFVLDWARTVHGACFVPMSRGERCALLRRLAVRLAAALRSEPFDPAAEASALAAGQEVGAALVGANFAAPEVLASTLRLVQTRLATDLGLDGPGITAGRVVAVVEGIAAGFTRALRDHTLDAQEEVRRAATVARAETERALRNSDARLRYAARHDPLTDLPNEASFLDRLTQLLTDPPAGVRLGVCSLDLDRFGAINDSLGPPVGDLLLVAVARRVSALAVEFGHRLARRSGDRFAILVEDSTSAEDMAKVADRVLAAFVEPFEVDGHELSIKASAGVVEQPAAATTPTELLRAADMALRWAKADGRGRWALFEEQRSSQDVARHRLTAQMPAAMRRGEFHPAYQPLVDLGTGGIAGFEALARWHHPQRGLLGADQFVSLAEDTGLIVPLGIRLLERACHDAAGWPAAGRGGRPPHVSVNLSSRQLRVPGLVGEVVEVLDRTGLPPERLQLEITESAMVGTDRQSVGALVALAGYGIRIVIDDFGTGYANFTYLYDLPVHGIKLAGELLRDCGPGGPDGTGHAVLDTLVTLGRRLGLIVTAEGVETSSQVSLLRELGCHIGQGFHFGRAVFAADVPGVLHR